MFSRFDTVHQRDIQTAQARRTNEQTELEYCCGCHRNNNDDNRKSNLLVNRTRELKTAGGHLMPPQQHLCNGLARPADYSIFCTGMRASPRWDRNDAAENVPRRKLQFKRFGILL